MAGPHWFLASTVATSVTGFGFPVDRLLPSHIVGIISLVMLVGAILAYYVYQLAGAWRWAYVVCAAVALYLNVFVGILQAFQKVPAFEAMAPKQSALRIVLPQTNGWEFFVLLGFSEAGTKIRDRGDNA